MTNSQFQEFTGEVYRPRRRRHRLDAYCYSSTVKGDNGDDTIDLASPLVSSLIDGGTDDDQITIATEVTCRQFWVLKKTALPNGDVTTSKIRGNEGNDTIETAGDLSGTIVNGNKDNTPLISPAVSNSSVYGGDENDGITQTAAAVYFDGSGKDTLTANTAEHTLIGGLGNDTISATGLRMSTSMVVMTTTK